MSILKLSTTHTPASNKATGWKIPGIGIIIAFTVKVHIAIKAAIKTYCECIRRSQ